MPQPEHLLLFTLTTVLIVVLPGPDFVLVTRNTLTGGRRTGFATAAGCVLGMSAWAALAAAGLTVLIAANPTLVTVLRLAGAAYLIYLGTSALVRLRRRWRAGTLVQAADPASGGEGEPTEGTGVHGGAPFWQGLLNNVLNPKPLAFFLTALPQFIDSPADATLQTAVLGSIVVLVTGAWWLIYILSITRLTEFLRRRRVRQGIELGSGVALTAFGVALALAA
ncbi:threonine/homoserine/homoserine lactone efflux protein [Nocardiopsis mwathae]|uniref:Threonine/homoserine/homoserine lactone efflux protein n=1 Tax=Nocardiopsis mwathae TaxID=1472723 RepID=A0A7W9YHP7_9ACTN|nr:LysE family translocator [Nocardiopsis mwathae]MBB6171416.1 threonine/homoserine/homoserine lactone efflux protein [Nocardiopsis mwathae]